MPISSEMQERIDALDYDHCLKPDQVLVLPNGSVLMFSPDDSGHVHFYENPLLDHVVTVKDDSNVRNEVKFKVSKTGFGISIALLDEGGNGIAEVGADFFQNQLSVIAHNPATFDGQDPVVKHCLIADVRAAVEGENDQIPRNTETASNPAAKAHVQENNGTEYQSRWMAELMRRCKATTD